MIPRTYPTLIDGRKAGYMRVFYLTSVTGLTKWIDYIPVKTVAFSAAAEGTTNANGHINVVQVASSTALRRWVDYIPVFEDGAATVPWSTNANGYIPVDQMLDLDFRAGILDSRITFTRADAVTCATYFDITGRMQTAAANVARFDYDPASPAGVTGPELRSGFSAQLVGSAALATFDASTGAGTCNRVDVNNQSSLRLSWTTGKTYAVSITNTGSAAISIRDFTGGTILSTINSGTSLSTNISSESGIRVQANSNGTSATFTVNSVQEVTFNPRGLLIEESRQNLLLQSRDMTQAAWTKTDVTPARTQVGIDGVANTACLMTEGSAGTATCINATAATVAAGSTITGSFVVKRGNTDWVRLIVGNDLGFTDGGQVWFNLATGAKGTTSARGAGTAVSGTIENKGGGWYRLAVTALPNGTYTTGYMTVVSASADNSTTRVSGATYIVDCAQLEVGAFATSIIPTTTTALTRAADSASMTGTNFSSWFNASAGTFVAELYRPVLPNQNNTLVRVDDGTTNNRHLPWLNAASALAGLHASGGVLTTAPTTANNAATIGNHKAAYTYNASGVTVCLNAGTVPADDTTNIPTGASMTRLLIGNNDAANFANGHIRALRYYPARLANATLQALTA